VEECRAVLHRLPRLHLAHLDLAGAYFRAGEFDACRTHLDLALDCGYPFPFVIYNYLACMAAETGDWRSARINLRRANRSRPAKLTRDNEQRLEAWLAAGGPASGRGPGLTAVHDFEVVSHLPPVQPCKPGSIILHGDGSEPDRVLGA
jgi:tetratricopeptide (TPR) repeat protein